MPICSSHYQPPRVLRNPHVNTIASGLLRRLSVPATVRRARITTPDNDFIDIDIHPCLSGAPVGTAIISHGLEGHSRRGYVLGVARALSSCGFQVLAWNMRSCSGEPNCTKLLYHMGETSDLAAVIARAEDFALPILLMGFSMGGNQICRYLGRGPVSPLVRAGAVISVPCDLPGAALKLDSPNCRVYLQYFLRSMRRKVREKALRFSEYPSIEGLENVCSFADFDSRFTAPVYGFASAADYWIKNSTVADLPLVRVPLFMLIAADDPFCSPACYPYETARDNPHIYLEVPQYGGHVGFASFAKVFYSEERVVDFASTVWSGNIWSSTA